MLITSLISLEIILLVFIKLHFYTSTELNTNKSLELILTVNGLFCAILVTYLLNQVSKIIEGKEKLSEQAVFFSQKITDFRRILKRLTDYYGVWENDRGTKSLFLQQKYRHIDFYDFKLMSISEYSPKDAAIIKELEEEENYLGGQSDLYLGMISLVNNRKNTRFLANGELYKHFQTSGIYTYKFVERCMEIDYLSRLGYHFQEGFRYINYGNLGQEHLDYIKECYTRIDKKYSNKPLNNALMADLCDDMHEYYFKELYLLLIELRKGFSSLNILTYLILFCSLFFGILLPFLIYFILEISCLKIFMTEVLIGINLGLLFFFVVNLYYFLKKEIIWA
ncbi:MAG: hypothetical protein ACEPOW_14420 [Bacteroidales bacterium]